MNTKIEQNTIKLQNLLEKAEDLPEAGGGAKPEQEKTLNVTENGSYKILPDSGKVISEAAVNVNVPSKYDEGYNAGHDVGFTDGKEVGKQEGYNEGYQASQDSIVVQEKTVDITENGTIEVAPDDGKYLSKVTVEVNVKSSSEDLNDVLAEQEELIDTLKAILKSKASGGDDGSDKFDASLDGSITEVNSTVDTTVPHCCRGLTNIKTVKLPNATTIATYAFYGCEGIIDVELGSATVINSSAFYDCKSLTRLDCGESPNFGGSALANCTALTTLIIRGTRVPTLSTSTFSGVDNDFVIYVPSDLIESYKTATNWSTFAAQFRAIEDYPDICGGA